MSPLMSIVVPTVRVGGLDVLWAGLERQTCKDFEIVLVDGIKRWRTKERGIDPTGIDPTGEDRWPVQHLEPVGNTFPRNAYCRSVNTGIRAARGDVVSILSDYTFLPPNYVERHLELHGARRDRVVLGPHLSVRCPPRRPPFNGNGYRADLDHYSSSGLELYVRDLEDGVLHSYMWSIFADPFEAVQLAQVPVETRFGSDPKVDLPEGPVDNVQLFFCRGESVKREHLIQVNGFDEALDGSHGYQDSDLAERLALLGLEFYNAPDTTCTIVNPRPYFPHARRDRSIESNGAYFLARKQAGFPGEVVGVRELG